MTQRLPPEYVDQVFDEEVHGGLLSSSHACTTVARSASLADRNSVRLTFEALFGLKRQGR